MASSNRHWPSMFKSKPCKNQQWSHRHDNNINNDNNYCARSSNNSPFSLGSEERSTPDPKPRWNPKPEQIRILEAIFNSGMVNPPRDEIRRIRNQLQEYGHVGDANVFYWFQNRKSRSKNKQRTLQNKTTSTVTATATATSSSPSSSDKNSPNRFKNNTNILGDEQFENSPRSVNQCNNYINNIITPVSHHSQNHEFVSHEPVFFPLHQNGISQGLYFSINNDNDNNNNNINHVQIINGCDTIHVTTPSNQTVGGFSSLLLGDMFGSGGGGGGGGGGESKRDDDVEKLHELSFLSSTPNITSCTLPSAASIVASTPISTAISSNLGQVLGLGEAGDMTGKMIVFINGMAIEVPSGPFNVKEEFGEEVMLVHATSGHPVVTNEWGVTLDGLQHGASYYLMGAHVIASPLLDKLHSTHDLLASDDFPYQI